MTHSDDTPDDLPAPETREETLDEPSSLEWSWSSPQDDPPDVVIITGLSGSGKSTAVEALEDLGFFCIDNLPVPLLPDVLELAAAGEPPIDALAFVIDTRGRMFLDDAEGMLRRLRKGEVSVRVLFLEADEESLVQRFSETRRHHPMSNNQEGPVRDAIREERHYLSNLRAQADSVIDTSDHTVHSLTSLVQERFGGGEVHPFGITVMSFGFKHGLPSECDLVFDLRFLPNPYYVDELREQDGRDEAVRSYVLEQSEAREFLEHFKEMLSFMIPLYESEGKSYLTIGIGCTGGHHRSVAVAEAIRDWFEPRDRDVHIRHRDVDK